MNADFGRNCRIRPVQSFAGRYTSLGRVTLTENARCCHLLGTQRNRPSRRVWTSAPSPPSPTLTRSARGSTRLPYAVRLCPIRGIRCAGRDRTDKCCPRTTDRHFPAGGSCSPLVCVDYLLVLVQQCRQPVRFLYACVKLSILPRKFIRLPLYRRDTDCTNELHLRARGAALRC
jgi:hypothetical protein